MKRLMEAFRVEADEHVQALSSGLLELEQELSPDEQARVVETIFREAHSLKGAARSVNIREIETICQSVENVFAIWKKDGINCEPEDFDVLHSAIDIVSMLLSAPHAASIPIADIVQQVEQLASADRAAMPAKGTPPRDHDPDTPVAHAAEPPPSTAPEPPPESTAARPEPPPRKDAPRHAPAPAERIALSQTVRISTNRLDAILLQAEEMLAVKLAVEQHAADLRDALTLFETYKQEWDKVSPEVRTARQLLTRQESRQGEGRDRASRQFTQLLEYLEQNQSQIALLDKQLKGIATSVEMSRRSVGGQITGLLDSVKDVLMLPFSSLVQRFPKMVRDLSRERGKQVELELKGSDVEIDRRILEELKDPLIHLVRNSVDHGIENPDERTRHGKAPRGRLTIATSQLGSNKIEILISDDGGGISLDRVKAVAVKNGLIAEREAEQIDDQDAVMLIFQSGFSTSPIITDISGRGLGMAIVREKVEKLGGLLSVETKERVGTTFRIVLPVTLATFRGVIVEAGGQAFVVPTTNVEQVVRITPDIIKTVENKATISLNDRAISLVTLSDVLELPHAAGDQHHSGFLQIMLLGNAEKRIAFSIDRVVNEQEVLVKSLGRQLSRVRNISGATVLGSGQVIPILNVADLMASATRVSAPAFQSGAGPEHADAPQTSILLVEDSVTSRMLLKGILESAEYRVKTAVDGQEAFTMLKTEPFDLVVSDIEMPRMDGFELTAKIRDSSQMADLPVVLVTSLEAREHRERGIEVGANAYIVKSSLDQSNLLEVVERLV